MNQIFLLCIVSFIVFVMYNLFGVHLYWILSVLAVLYLFWGQNITNKILHPQTNLEKFIESDPQLKQALVDLRVIESQDHLMYKVINEDIMSFLTNYILFFRKDFIGNLDFQEFNDKRRTILNDLSKLTVSNVTISQNLIDNIADCLWKYVHVIGTKFDLRFEEPLAINAFVNQDMF